MQDLESESRLDLLSLFNDVDLWDRVSAGRSATEVGILQRFSS